jgi:phage shock protein A
MGNQYSEQYYIDKIDDLETEIEDTNDNLKEHRKCIKALNSKIDLLTTAMDAIIQKTKQTEELTETLSQFKEFFESNPHVFHLEEYDTNYNTDDQSEEEEKEEESKTRKQPMRKCKPKTPQRIQPKRKVKKATQPKSPYR